MTKKEAKKIVSEMGLTLTWKDGEFRVNFVNGKEATAYYTSDIEDAVDTAKAMARKDE